MQSIAALMPPLSGAIIECRIGRDSEPGDFSLRVMSEDNGRDIFSGFNPNWMLPHDLMVEPLWQRISDFCQLWSDEKSIINRHVDTLWMEFDYGASKNGIPLPCIFFDTPYYENIRSMDLSPCTCSIPKKGDYLQNPYKETERIIDLAYECLLAKSISPAIRNNLLHCLSVLPVNAKIQQIGIMPARQSDSVRVCILIPVKKVLNYLSDIKATNHIHLHRINDMLDIYSEKILLDLDINTVVSSKIGFEIKPKAKDLWPALLDHLLKERLCSKSNHKALLSWPGYSEKFSKIRDIHQISLRCPNFKDIMNSILWVRRLNHIKIVHQPGRQLEAKAYLFIGFGWLAKK